MSKYFGLYSLGTKHDRRDAIICIKVNEGEIRRETLNTRNQKYRGAAAKKPAKPAACMPTCTAVPHFFQGKKRRRMEESRGQEMVRVSRGRGRIVER